jgi:hypothetical protein
MGDLKEASKHLVFNKFRRSSIKKIKTNRQHKYRKYLFNFIVPQKNSSRDPVPSRDGLKWDAK